MNKILLITTKGCKGCSIMRESIEHALIATKKEITFKEIDSKDLFATNKELYNSLNLKDFPTTVFLKEENIVRKEIGSRPYIVVLRWIDIDFK